MTTRQIFLLKKYGVEKDRVGFIERWFQLFPSERAEESE
jgi:hypothetical protein